MPNGTFSHVMGTPGGKALGVLPPERKYFTFFFGYFSRIKRLRRIWYNSTGGRPAHSEYKNFRIIWGNILVDMRESTLL